MIFTFDERPSDSPFVERIWRTQSERTGDFLSIAASHWEMVISSYHGKTTVTVRGPETKVTPLDVTLVGTEFFGIVFKLGTVMPYLPASTLVDGDVDLPEASSKSFWLNGSAWESPDFENVETFVDRLVHEDVLVVDPVVKAVLQDQPQAISSRTVRRRFLHATGLTHKAIQQIERAQLAAALLEQGVSILDAVYQAGYADQPHMTRSLKRFSGQTPAQIARVSQPT